MKTVAQTVIEADRFYTIAAHTGNVIQAVEASKDGGHRSSGQVCPQARTGVELCPGGEGVYRIRNRASGKLLDLTMTGTANGTWLHLWRMWAAPPRCGSSAPRRKAPCACARPGPAASAWTPWAWVRSRCRAADLAGSARCRPAVDHR